MGKVYVKCPGDRVSIPGRVILKTWKLVLGTSLLNTQHYKVLIQGRESCSPFQLCDVAIEKGSLPLVANFTYYSAGYSLHILSLANGNKEEAFLSDHLLYYLSILSPCFLLEFLHTHLQTNGVRILEWKVASLGYLSLSRKKNPTSFSKKKTWTQRPNRNEIS